MFIVFWHLSAGCTYVRSETNILLRKVPACLPEADRIKLEKKRQQTINLMKQNKDAIDTFNSICKNESQGSPNYLFCVKEKQRIIDQRDELKQAINEITEKMNEAENIWKEKVGEYGPTGDLINSMNAASALLQKRGRQPKGPADKREIVGLNCQDFFRFVFRDLEKRRGQKWRKWAYPYPRKNADEIAKQIIKDGEKLPLLWREVNEGEVQGYANRGAIVVGVLKANGRTHGHLSIGAPTPPCFDSKSFDPKGEKGHGPFVRDGNEHDLRKDGFGYAMSSWGAVRASRATPLEETRWFLFAPSLP